MDFYPSCMYPVSYILCCTLSILCCTLSILCRTSSILCCTSYILCRTSYILCCTSGLIHHLLCILCHVYCVVYPICAYVVIRCFHSCYSYWLALSCLALLCLDPLNSRLLLGTCQHVVYTFFKWVLDMHLLTLELLDVTQRAFPNPHVQPVLQILYFSTAASAGLRIHHGQRW